jgi:signal transduction histidine kinase
MVQDRTKEEAASAAQRELLCSISQELRTPLNAMLGFAQLMQRDRKQPLSARHQSRVAQILEGGKHLVRLLDDLVDLSSSEAGRLSITLELVDVRDAFEQVRATLDPLALASGVNLQLLLPRQVPLIVADAARFQQILINFGSNAIKYNRAHGKVTFAASVLSPEYVRTSVSDTGVGIPEDQRDRLFEPFRRAGQARGDSAGTGMGLAISKRLASLMNGVVGFSSTWMEGSEFWVDLPLHAAASPAEL